MGRIRLLTRDRMRGPAAAAVAAACALTWFSGAAGEPAVSQRPGEKVTTQTVAPPGAQALTRDPEVSDSSARGAGGIVPDRHGYVRQHVAYGLMRLDSDVLKARGEQLLGAELGRLERTVKRLLKGRAIDWEKTDWRDVACYHFSATQGADDTEAAALLPTVFPPANWMQLEFDDESWPRQRMGWKATVTPQYGVGRACYGLHQRAVYARTYFQVLDPRLARGDAPAGRGGELTLRVTYRGGVRVFLNGTEIARRHLPPGEPGPETLAEPYGPEAYVAREGEYPANRHRFIGDLRCPYADAPRPFNCPPEYRAAYGSAFVNEKGWQRLMPLRDRVLGPIKLPTDLLRKGPNVLAIEMRLAPYHPMILPGAGGRNQSNWGWDGCNASCSWPHVGLVDIELRGGAGQVVPATGPSDGASKPTASPARMQAWVDDVHRRMFNRDFNPPGWPAGAARFVAARNGRFAAQLGVRADGELTGLKVTPGELALQGGTGSKLVPTIPASALEVRYGLGQPISRLVQLGWFRCVGLGDPFCPMAMVGMQAYSPTPNVFAGEPKGTAREREAFQQKVMDTYRFFDQISLTPPGRVPADSCQPIWLTLTVPDHAPPGLYEGTVRIEAEGAEPISLPIKAEVFAWRVPDSLNFQTVVQSEQSPYGLAKHYKVPLWSDRHFELMDSSFRQLARLGADWVFVPVLLDSELGNRDDMMIPWTRKKDGALKFDYAVLDRYLKVAVKHLGKPRVVCFLVMHGCASPSTTVRILDEGGGKAEVVEVGPARGDEREPLWRQFAIGLKDHLQTLGLADALHWGYAFDDTPDPELIRILAEATPGVPWAAGGHARQPDQTFRATARAYGVDLAPKSLRGWKNPFVHLLMPRIHGSVICVEGTSTPFTWRVLCDRAIHCGFNGLGRMGADYFDLTWLAGFPGRDTYMLVGRSCVQTLWPGDTGVESGARNEIMLEGIQEAETRTFLEQALDRGLIRDALAAKVEQVLTEHFRGTLHIATGGVDYETMDNWSQWQQRSRRLYETAAEVAAKIGLDCDRDAFGQSRMEVLQGGQVRALFGGDRVVVPALGKTELTVKLRNWTGRPRPWRATTDQPWIVPQRREGTAGGFESLAVTLSAQGLQEGTELSGRLEIQDVQTGTVSPVRIEAVVGKAIELRLGQEIRYVTGGGAGADMVHEVRLATQPVFNVPVGQSESREYLLVNHAASALSWKVDCSHAWLKPEPAGGTIPAAGTISINLTAAPKDTTAARHATTVTLTAADGAIRQSCEVQTFVIPPYSRPVLPTGEAVYLHKLDQKKFVKSHVEAGRRAPGGASLPVYHRNRGGGERMAEWERPKDLDLTAWPYKMGGKTFAHGLWVNPEHQTVYNIEGAGFTAFAAEVGFFDKAYAGMGPVVFEVYVDGNLRTQSTVLKPGDAPQLLVVDNLRQAKELKLLTRRDNLTHDGRCLATWGDPRLFK